MRRPAGGRSGGHAGFYGASSVSSTLIGPTLLHRTQNAVEWVVYQASAISGASSCFIPIV